MSEELQFGSEVGADASSDANGDTVSESLSAEPSAMMSVEEIAALVESSDLAKWQQAAQQFNITERQLAYLVRRIVEMDAHHWQDSEELLAELVRTILRHPRCTVVVCRALATSECPTIWLELAKSQSSDSDSLRTVHQKNWQWYEKAYLSGSDLSENPTVKMTQSIMTALVRNPQTPDEILRTLMPISMYYWRLIVSRPYCNKWFLDYVLRRFEELPDSFAVLNRAQMLSYINRNGCADDEIWARVATMRRFDGLVRRVQDQTLTEEELIRIAKTCAGTRKYPWQVRQIAHSLVWHTNATTKVMHELVKASHSAVCYLVARSDLADEYTLMELVHKVDNLRKHNVVFYEPTVKEILRHPNTTKAVIMALLKASPSRTVYESIAVTDKADYEVLQRVADLIRAGVDGFDNNSEKSLSDWFPHRAVDEMMLHPNGGRPIYQYLREALRRNSWAHRTIEYDWDYIETNACLWKGIDPGVLKTDPSIVKLQSYQAATHDCWQSYIGADALEDALQCEWMRAEELDRLVYRFAFKTGVSLGWDEYLASDYHDSGKPRDQVLFERYRLVLRHLIDHPELTELSRAALLSLKDLRGDYLREYVQSKS